jgi:predicted anti-sigma-YlaC factor YlaD
MLTCRELVALLTDYLEGSLSLGDRVRFQLHLGMCTNCRAYLRQMRQTVGVLQKLPPEEAVPPGVRQDLLRRFQGWKASAPATGRG